ncbi:MAG: hypothetical protein RI575_04105 [Balneolaceae bacterium]|nr:hypothetical protein [Balneolaceae bacterium]MDR9407500.1 hypothetical protein [Balneolaceae bacterium]
MTQKNTQSNKKWIVSGNPSPTGSPILDGLTNGASYAIKTKPSSLKSGQASKLHNQGLSRNQFNHPVVKKWKDELPIPIYEVGFRKRIQEDILALIPTSSAVENIADHGARNGEIAKDAFDSAIDSLPPGGRLIIPDGTYYLNDYTISKSLIVDCRGTLKRMNFGENGQTTSTQIIKLEAPCVWDGGIMDGNRESWMSHGFTGRHYSIQVKAQCIIKNVTGLNSIRRTDHRRFRWSGFRIEDQAYLENCVSERAVRGFNVQPSSTMYKEDNDGTISEFKGVYFYKCRSNNYEEKGFGTGGTNGWIIVDDCGGYPAPYKEIRADSLFLWETDSNISEGHQITSMLHTVIMKNCNIKEWVQYYLIKSAQLKWIIFDHCDLTNYGLGWDQGAPSKIYFAQTKENTVRQVGTSILSFRSKFRCIDYNDGQYPYNSSLAGKTFPIVCNEFDNREDLAAYQKNDRVTSIYFFDSELECVKNEWYRGGHAWRVFWAENTGFMVHETGEAFVWSEEDGDQFVDKFVFDNCTFTDTDGNRTWIFDSRGDIPEDSLIIIKPKGNPREGLSEYSYRRSF